MSLFGFRQFACMQLFGLSLLSFEFACCLCLFSRIALSRFFKCALESQDYFLLLALYPLANFFQLALVPCLQFLAVQVDAALRQLGPTFEFSNCTCQGEVVGGHWPTHFDFQVAARRSSDNRRACGQFDEGVVAVQQRQQGG